MEGEQLQRVVEFVREWNTNSKHCHTAQKVLTAILQCHPPSALVQVGGWAEQREGGGMQAAEGRGGWCRWVQVPGIRQAVEGLLPYTERHLARIQRLVRSTFLLDYTLAAMVVLPPGEGLEQEGAEEEKKAGEGGKRRKRGKAGHGGGAVGQASDAVMEEDEGRGGGSGGEADPMGEEEAGGTGGEAHQNGEVEGGVDGSPEKSTKKQRKVRRTEGGVGEGGDEGGKEQVAEKGKGTEVVSEGMPMANGNKVRKKKMQNSN